MKRTAQKGAASKRATHTPLVLEGPEGHGALRVPFTLQVLRGSYVWSRYNGSTLGPWHIYRIAPQGTRGVVLCDGTSLDFAGHTYGEHNKNPPLPVDPYARPSDDPREECHDCRAEFVRRYSARVMIEGYVSHGAAVERAAVISALEQLTASLNIADGGGTRITISKVYKMLRTLALTIAAGRHAKP